MNEALAILNVFKAALDATKSIQGFFSDEERADLEARYERAAAYIKDPTKTHVEDSARRAELERILKGNR